MKSEKCYTHAFDNNLKMEKSSLTIYSLIILHSIKYMNLVINTLPYDNGLCWLIEKHILKPGELIHKIREQIQK